MPVTKAIGWSKNLSENTHSLRDLVRNPVEDELHPPPQPVWTGEGMLQSSAAVSITVAVRESVRQSSDREVVGNNISSQ